MDPPAEDALQIELSLSGQGWASCRLRFGSEETLIEGFGDCTDAFGDLVRAALLIVTGAYTATFSFDGEPYEWRWKMARDIHFPEKLGLTILGFPDVWRPAPDSEGKLLWAISCRPDDFGWAVANAFQAFLETHGVDRFNDQWRLAPFPLRGLRSLQTALATEEPRLKDRSDDPILILNWMEPDQP